MRASIRQRFGAYAACVLLGLAGAYPVAAGAACVSPAGGVGGTGTPANGGIGGTGTPANGGIGGTGAPANGGIGGTGAPHTGGVTGGTGIVGTITGFASVCVNGVEVHYDADTAVTTNSRAADTKALQVGQVVAIEAMPSARGLVARRIDILHAIEGPITEVQPTQGLLHAMGQVVRVPPRAFGGEATLDRLRPGMLVQVSGLRNAGGEVLASRLDLAPDLAEHTTFGAAAVVSRGGFELHGTRVAATPPALRAIHGGTETLVRGHWDGSELRASEVRLDPSLPFIGRVMHVVVEGLVHDWRGGALRVGRYDVTLSSSTRITGVARDLATDQRVLVTGRLGVGGRITAEAVEVERGPPDASRGSGMSSRRKGAVREEHRGDGASGSREGRGELDRSGPSDQRVDRSGPRIEGADESGPSVERVERSGPSVERVDRSGSSVERVDRSGPSVERVDRSGSANRGGRR